LRTSFAVVDQGATEKERFLRREKRASQAAAARKRRRTSNWMAGSVAVLCAVAALLAVHFTGVLEPATAPASTDVAVANPETLIPASLQDDPERPNFRYSIVPGGVRTPQEVMEAMRDPVVAEHYARVKPAELRSEKLAEPMTAHVSYRVADKVYWTKKTLTLKAGEKVLTDGTTTMRERCGNLISMQPLAPSLDGAEPTAPEFEMHVAPMVPTASVAQADQQAPGGFPLSNVPPVVSMSALKGLTSAGGPGGGGGGGGFVGPNLPPAGSSDPPGKSGDPNPNKPPTTLGDPPGVTPTPTPTPGGDPKDPPVGDPRLIDPPAGDPPVGDPPGPEGTPVALVDPPTVVPEPSTWLLVATGLGAAGIRLFRKKR